MGSGVRRMTYSVEEAAAVLGMSKSTVYDSIRNGELRGVQLGRRVVIPCDALEALVGPIDSTADPSASELRSAESRPNGSLSNQGGAEVNAVHLTGTLSANQSSVCHEPGSKSAPCSSPSGGVAATARSVVPSTSTSSLSVRSPPSSASSLAASTSPSADGLASGSGRRATVPSTPASRSSPTRSRSTPRSDATAPENWPASMSSVPGRPLAATPVGTQRGPAAQCLLGQAFWRSVESGPEHPAVGRCGESGRELAGRVLLGRSR